MKKNIKIIIGVIIFLIILITVIYYLLFYVLSGVQTSFAKTCRSIKVGMEKENVLVMMKKFENKNKVEFEEKKIP